MATLAACAAASCVLTSDAQGLVSTGVTPQSAGTVSLVASDGGVSVSGSFTAKAKPDTLAITSKPANGALVGDIAALPFTVQVTAGDGTAAVGRSVTVSVTNGTLAACAAASCVLISDAQGLVSTGVTPQSAGTVGLVASDGGVSVSGSFTAKAKPDTLAITSTPADGALVGDVATLPFTVQVTAGDGSAGPERSVTVSVTNGTLAACNASSCVLTSDVQGLVSSGVTPQSAGTVSLVASDGSVSVSAFFSAKSKPDMLAITSTPANGALVGDVAALPFTVQVTAGDGSAGTGRSVTVSVTNGTLAACAASSCVLISDAQGMVSTGVTAQSAGTVGLVASDGSVSVSGSFTARAKPDTLAIISTPANGALVGDVAALPFTVQVTAGDGSAGAGRSVTVSVTNGSLAACSAGSCVLTADANGTVSSGVIPSSAGTVTLSASEASVVVTASFFAAAKPDELAIVSAPPAQAYVGDTVAARLRVLLADGVTPAAGKTLAFALTGGSGSGSATLGGCAGTPCTAVSDAAGYVAITLTAVAEGTVTVTVNEPAGGSNTVELSFAAQPRPDSMVLVSAPAGSGLVGDPMAVAFVVRVLEGDGATAAAGRTVNVHGERGQRELRGLRRRACAACRRT